MIGAYSKSSHTSMGIYKAISGGFLPSLIMVAMNLDNNQFKMAGGKAILLPAL
jgi:hypothetical protein